MNLQIYETINNNKGKKMVLSTIIAKEGSAPREPGTKMLIFEDGTITGTIGGGFLEISIIKKALEIIKNNDKACVVTFNMGNAEAEKEGMVCGGTAKIFLERLQEV
jgi:xanthine dehydrogenase accessory factor